MLLESIISAMMAVSGAPGGTPADAPDTLSAATVTASFKEEQTAAISGTRLGMAVLERRTVRSVKDITSLVPNFYQPDYGSRTTSSIYVRGFGSRIDQPVVGMYVDGIPLMNKSSYDFEFMDVKSVSVLRGPQGTLYGRNTSGGVVGISTLSPFEAQGLALSAEWSPVAAGKVSVRYADTPRSDLGYSVSAFFSAYDGDFVNAYDGSVCDPGRYAGLRARLSRRGSLDMDNILSLGYLDEGGYAYARLDDLTGKSLGIDYNDPCGYRRLTVTDALTAAWKAWGRDFSAAFSWQMLDDAMQMDNDFTALSLFSMEQRQREHAFTFEIQARTTSADGVWTHLDGAFLFGKYLDVTAPVMFKRDGIEQLILDNANRGISTVFPGHYLDILEPNFQIASDFRMPSHGVAMFRSSKAEIGDWTLSAGVRLDLEHSAMRYASEGGMSYLFSLTMDTYKPLVSTFKGSDSQTSFKILPYLSCVYSFEAGQAFVNVSRGHKAGGFNTQIFSDILQNRMMSDMLEDIGLHARDAGGGYDSAEHTRYRPESNWNAELGARLRPSSGNASLDLTAFLVECRDQQVTVMPPGNGTGRMMSNAARSRSLGLEASGSVILSDFTFRASYGLTRARFIEYVFGGGIDYSGKYLPYAPQNTVDASVTYARSFGRGWLERISATAACRGAGRIWWDEANTLSQPFYSLLDASLSLHHGGCTLSFWGRNILGEEYGTFRFRSVSRDFISMGRPFRAGVRITVEIQ